LNTQKGLVITEVPGQQRRETRGWLGYLNIASVTTLRTSSAEDHDHWPEERREVACG
jgi:hypothetical protein